MLQFTKNERKILVVIALLLIVGIAIKYYQPAKKEIQVEFAEEEVNSEEEITEDKPEIAVHITGAVASPGVYFLPEGSRAYEAVDLAGGPLKKANIDLINLAQPLYDGQQIFVPFEVENDETTETGGVKALPESSSGKINLNTASLEELQTLPGIGEVKAQSIIDYRDETGFFTSIEELTEVNGIGSKTLENLRDHITIY